MTSPDRSVDGGCIREFGAPVWVMPGVDHEAVTTGPAVLSTTIIKLLHEA